METYVGDVLILCQARSGRSRCYWVSVSFEHSARTSISASRVSLQQQSHGLAIDTVIRIRPAFRRRMSLPILWIRYSVPVTLVSMTCRTRSKSWSRRARPSPRLAFASRASTGGLWRPRKGNPRLQRSRGRRPGFPPPRGRRRVRLSRARFQVRRRRSKVEAVLGATPGQFQPDAWGRSGDDRIEAHC
jgi:hypothetical protein